VWSNDRKIAALGIHCKRYVTYHGLALNCNVDLNWFDKIIPCGINDKAVTSLSQLLHRDVTVPEVTPLLIKSFEKVFETSLHIESNANTNALLQEVLNKS
jgi:lipoyl(octanoyl) transferase